MSWQREAVMEAADRIAAREMKDFVRGVCAAIVGCIIAVIILIVYYFIP